MLLLPRLLSQLLLTVLRKLQLFQLHTSTTDTMVVPFPMLDVAMLDTHMLDMAMLDTHTLDTHTLVTHMLVTAMLATRMFFQLLLLPRKNKVQSSTEGKFGNHPALTDSNYKRNSFSRLLWDNLRFIL